MYNLQNAKEEIDEVAKHTIVLTDYVFSLGERVHAHDGTQEKRLETFKDEILKAIEARFADLERKMFGGESPPERTSIVAELGSKISALSRAKASPEADHTPDQHHDQHS
jgi:hypothetical protein